MRAQSNQNQEGQSRILVVEDDTDIRQLITESLLQQNYEVFQAENGDDAWELLKSKQFEGLILDWKFPGSISGLAFLNRMRLLPGSSDMPVIVISGFLQSKDFSFLLELPFTEKLEKPFSVTRLLNLLTSIKDEVTWFKRHERYIIASFQSLEAQFDDNAVLSIRQTISSSPKPMRLLVMGARYLRDRLELGHAEDYLLYALKIEPKSPMILNELGKLYLRMGRKEEAKAALMKALDYSPDNIERLCNIANIHLNDRNVTAAQEFLDRASSIDSENQLAKSGQALCRNLATFLCDHDAATIPNSYAGLLNAVGISMVQEKKFSEGLEHYQAAMSYLGSNPLKAKLAFNLGLGYLRWGKNEQALSWFKRAKELDANCTKAIVQLDRLKDLLGLLEDSEITDAPLPLAQFRSDLSPTLDEAFDDDSYENHDTHEGQVTQEAATSPANQQSQTDSNQGDEAFLIKNCPIIKDLMNFYLNEGIYAKGQLNVLKSLLNTYGSEKLTVAIKVAIKTKTATALAIANHLNLLSQNKTNQAG